MSSIFDRAEDSNKDVTNHTNNFSYNNSINNVNLSNQTSPSIPNTNANIQPKPAYPFTYIINPLALNNPNFKQLYPQLYQNMNNINALNNQSQPDNTNNNSTNPSIPQNTQMKMPMMGIPVIFSPFLYNAQDQTPVGEKCKIWVGKIPEGISETFIKT